VPQAHILVSDIYTYIITFSSLRCCLPGGSSVFQNFNPRTPSDNRLTVDRRATNILISTYKPSSCFLERSLPLLIALP
jgi:hypothetical protein